MKVWIVEYYWDNGEMYDDFAEDFSILGVFSSSDKALKFVKSYTPDPGHEYEIVSDTVEDDERVITTSDHDAFYEEGHYYISISEWEVE